MCGRRGHSVARSSRLSPGCHLHTWWAAAFKRSGGWWTPPISVPRACANDGGPAPRSAALSLSARRSSAARWRRRSRVPATQPRSRRSRRPRLTPSAALRVPCAWKCSRSRCRCPAVTCEWQAPAGEGARDAVGGRPAASAAGTRPAPSSLGVAPHRAAGCASEVLGRPPG